MPKVFITGSSGVGKSTVIKRLSERGFTAYDTDDMPDTTRLEDRATGEPREWPEGYVDWNKYLWNWQRSEIEKLLESDETVFIGAIVGNWKDFATHFDTVIALTVDPETHGHQLRNRTSHTYGQTEENIAEDVQKQAEKLGRFVAAGAKVVKNDRPIDDVVDEILAISHVGQ